jgi:hypothetical protein
MVKEINTIMDIGDGDIHGRRRLMESGETVLWESPTR